MKKLLALLFVAFTFTAYSQKIKLVEGSSSVLKGQTGIAFEFTYDNIGVGKFPKEQDYIAKKKAEYNEKEPGKGDTWEKAWFADRKDRFEPRFIESFTAAGYSSKADAQYTLILQTIFIEPGFNVGVMRRPAYIDAVAILVASNDKAKILAKWTIDNAPGRDAMGFDFDSGLRMQESYATAGKRLGRLIQKELGK